MLAFSSKIQTIWSLTCDLSNLVQISTNHSLLGLLDKFISPFSAISEDLDLLTDTLTTQFECFPLLKIFFKTIKQINKTFIIYRLLTLIGNKVFYGKIIYKYKGTCARFHPNYGFCFNYLFSRFLVTIHTIV